MGGSIGICMRAVLCAQRACLAPFFPGRFKPPLSNLEVVISTNLTVVSLLSWH